jgi:CRP/FNR family transcriptional regulator
MTKQEAPSCETCGSRHSSLFAYCTGPDLHNLDQHKSCGKYAKGETLIEEGRYANGVYCIEKGVLKLTKHGLEGKEHVIGFATPGQFIGYVSFITEQPCTITAQAIQDTVVCFVPRDTFRDLLRTNPMLNRELLKTLCRELEIEQTRLMNMAQKNVRERLAETLLILQETFHNRRGRPELIDLTLPREDLANLVGTATESVIRMLSEFKNDGIIATEGKRIIIKDEAKLAKLARLSPN